MPWVLSTDSSLFSFETDSSDSQQEITQQGYPTQCKKRWNYCIITVQKHILSLAEVISNRWMAFGLKKHPWADLLAQHHRQPERLCHGLRQRERLLAECGHRQRRFTFRSAQVGRPGCAAGRLWGLHAKLLSPPSAHGRAACASAAGHSFVTRV